MKIGVSLMRVSYKGAVEVARVAESLGYDSIWAADHLVWPVQYAANYPYDKSGRPGVPSNVPTLDCWAYLSWLAANTRSIKLGTAVYILPLRDPLVTARAAMTVDLLSGGRLLFGVGAGWLAEEFEYAGLDYRSRGRRMDECLEVIKRLWTEDTPSYDGEFIHIGKVNFEPKPLTKPHPPFVIGGESDAALRRAARLGDGWIGVPHNPDEAAGMVKTLLGYRAQGPLAGQPLDITIMTMDSPSPADIARFEAAGVTRLVISPFARTSEAAAGLEKFAKTVMRAA
jgi:probable F420-dependent oxidoreductase